MGIHDIQRDNCRLMETNGNYSDSETLLETHETNRDSLDSYRLLESHENNGES